MGAKHETTSNYITKVSEKETNIRFTASLFGPLSAFPSVILPIVISPLVPKSFVTRTYL